VKIINKDGVDERLDDQNGVYIRSGIVVVTKGASVPDNTVI
jgi:glucose-1-phosphate adenylyltransferase